MNNSELSPSGIEMSMESLRHPGLANPKLAGGNVLDDAHLAMSVVIAQLGHFASILGEEAEQPWQHIRASSLYGTLYLAEIAKELLYQGMTRTRDLEQQAGSEVVEKQKDD